MLNLTIINSLCVICILLFLFLLFLLTNNNYVTYMLYFILNICFLYSIGDIAWFACFASCTCVCVCLFVLVSHSIAVWQLWTIVLAPVENGVFSSMGLGWDTNRGLFGNEVMFKYCCDKSETLKHFIQCRFQCVWITSKLIFFKLRKQWTTQIKSIQSMQMWQGSGLRVSESWPISTPNRI